MVRNFVMKRIVANAMKYDLIKLSISFLSCKLTSYIACQRNDGNG